MYDLLQGQIQNTRMIAESGEGDMHDLRSLATKVKALGGSLRQSVILGAPQECLPRRHSVQNTSKIKPNWVMHGLPK